MSFNAEQWLKQRVDSNGNLPLRISTGSDEDTMGIGPCWFPAVANLMRDFVDAIRSADRLETEWRERIEEIRSRQDSRRGFGYHSDLEYLLGIVDKLQRGYVPQEIAQEQLAYFDEHYYDQPTNPHYHGNTVWGMIKQAVERAEESENKVAELEGIIKAERGDPFERMG
jgi:hypothetical protein